jgi:hypothetical protein
LPQDRSREPVFSRIAHSAHCPTHQAAGFAATSVMSIQGSHVGRVSRGLEGETATAVLKGVGERGESELVFALPIREAVLGPCYRASHGVQGVPDLTCPTFGVAAQARVRTPGGPLY